MTIKYLKELIETNRIPDDAIIKITDPEEGGMHAVTGATYGNDAKGQYTVELYCDEP